VQWFRLAGWALFAALAAFCFWGDVCTRFYLHIVFGELGDVGWNNDIPKVTDSAGFFVTSMLIHEAEEKLSPLSDKMGFSTHGWGRSTRG
jgi:hypothetical protein